MVAEASLQKRRVYMNDDDMRTLISHIKRFGSDQRGEVPMDFIALTASVILMGAVYAATHSGEEETPGPDWSEEVYVRKCAHVRTGGTDTGLTEIRNGGACN